MAEEGNGLRCPAGESHCFLTHAVLYLDSLTRAFAEITVTAFVAEEQHRAGMQPGAQKQASQTLSATAGEGLKCC